MKPPPTMTTEAHVFPAVLFSLWCSSSSFFYISLVYYIQGLHMKKKMLSSSRREVATSAVTSFLLLLLVGVTRTAAATENDETCRLWLAPSYLSTGSTVKYGLFAGIDYAVNEIIPDIEIGFPFVDFLVDPNKNTRYNKGILDYLEGLMWTADYAGAKFEGNHTATTFIPGVGALSNYHSGYSNVDWLQGSVLLRERQNDLTIPGQAHLSRGAISNTYNLTMVATRHVPAGMELFANYGDVWDDKSNDDQFQDKIHRRDYVDADAVLDRIVDFFTKFENEMDDDFKEDLLDFMLDKVLLGHGEKRAKVIKALIPASPRRLQRVQEAGGTFMYRYADIIRTPKWLKKHALCVDKLYMDKSTVPEAGRGAFARLPIKKGEIISPIPTVLIGQRDLLEMFEIEMTNPNPGPSSNKRKPIQVFNRERPLGKQLVTNYCYGHPESSLFLLPQAPMVNYVNHAPTWEQVNAHLQWSTHDYVSNDVATHDHTVEEVTNFRSNMVVLELVADKDIAVGEEVFINYGPDWMAAWDEYKTSWEEKHKNDKSWPLKAEDIRATFKDRPYPVGTTTMLPDGTATVCFIKTAEADDGTPNANDLDEEILKWIGPVAYEDYIGIDSTFCDLIAVEEDGQGSWVYRAKTRPPGAKSGDDVLVEVYGIPHVAITVVDQPYRSDVLSNPNAFRHYIAVPDQQWPQLWRDLRD